MISVLIADDQELVRDGLASLLHAQRGIEVVGTAADGAAAVRAARELRPDVTLMDVRMPGTDGIEATRQLMADATPPTRVVVLTTFDEDDLVMKALQAGASGFLLKDLPRQRLVEALHAVTEGDLQLAPSVTQRLVERHLRRAPAPERSAAIDRLSDRETEVLRQVARGATNAEIADELYLSESTVKTHVSRLLAKVGARDRVQLVIAAYDCGLVP
ncbi:MAG TPA: response regulator transcription factor [Marmoricola sp.]|nr:response regulator transcription factor [Marmoricola sp.]